ncbi:F-box protein At3g54460-like isoform X2 [Aristolochia californica]|uniref:F-box protein At3g54460-like isoform X2 n=1 Tax=Aristolochia californica TaxID=171875 RepID=UPI0035D81534
MAGNHELQLHRHKLCGFLRAVLSVNPLQILGNSVSEALTPGSRCSLFREGSVVGFRSEDGLFSLLPIDARDNATPDNRQDENADRYSSAVSNSDLSTSRVSGASRKRQRAMGLVGGSLSVVHQIHALKLNKCLEIEARVVEVLLRNAEARAVILIDVFLPIAVWSGWQFPKAGQIAASLFRHLRCDWKERSSLLACCQDQKKLDHGDDSIWRHPDCHVLGCTTHCNMSGPTKRKLFELYEIFKSLRAIGKDGKTYATIIKPANPSLDSGIWDLSDDLLTNVLTLLSPRDLLRVAATCHHFRSLAIPIMPCMKLKLFPHQQAAVKWMLHRECNPEVLPHPLYMEFSTEDGFTFYLNAVSGEILTAVAPTVTDFRGGMFCDEPGLGKTITTLSLILKTQGMLADPPEGADVVWCTHHSDQRCGYYEISSDKFTRGSFLSACKRTISQHGQRKFFHDKLSPEVSSADKSKTFSSKRGRITSGLSDGSTHTPLTDSLSATHVVRCTRSLSGVKRHLLDVFDRNSSPAHKKKVKANGAAHTSKSGYPAYASITEQVDIFSGLSDGYVKSKQATSGYFESNETWVQCDACSKWRKLSDGIVLDATAAWFCSMNADPLHKSCTVPEEPSDHKRSITDLPGFYTKGTPQGKEHNITFFQNVLKEDFTLINSETKKALKWLANLSDEKLAEMQVVGLRRPVVDTGLTGNLYGYHKIFQAFGLIRKTERGTSRWYYPSTLAGSLAFDTTALQIALTKPLDVFRLYLSRATLVVVPANLVDHWRNQILKHVRPGQLRTFIWTDQRTPPAHNLAWDFDVVIITFNRLSAEWSSRMNSILLQVHWLRVLLDEGHTLGSSLSLTNKLQMAISLSATNRWLLTGTPTPNTPSSQVAHLQPMLKFLHEQAYGQNQKLWEAGILRPFEAEMEEGRARLLQLLSRCMISARKIDLQTIPPCMKKVTFLDFTEQHAKTYNELVVTVRRNILMADWNDPSHVESLLNAKQWKFRSNTIRNVRLSCCVAGHIKVTNAGQDIQETMDILVEQGLDPASEEYVYIKYSLLNGGDCFRCQEWCRLPVITPCKHLLCLDCVALDSERCTLPGCGNPYEMQNPDTLTRPENPNPKWPVPKDLIELQPSYKQDNWDPDWHATSSSKVAYLVERLKALQEVNKKLGYCQDEYDSMIPLDEVLLSSQRCHSDILVHHQVNTESSDKSHGILPEKVIIFSQFLEHIHVIEQQLMSAGIKYAGMYSPMHSSNKLKYLTTFQHDPNCMALLMDGSAALGLDLSFVTHVFLMEPIWDRR